jgi:Flp pilus assembly protein TadG
MRCWFALGRRLAGDRRGTTAVEFGLVALPLFVLVFAIAEMGLDFYCRSNLDVVSQRVARQIAIGAVQADDLDVNGFRTLVCGDLPSVLSCSNLVFSVQTVPSSFYGLTTSYQASNGLLQYVVTQPSLDQSLNKFCPGDKNQFVVLQLLYAMPVVTGIWLTSAVTYKGRSVRVIGATQVFRNESFLGANTAAGC